MPRYFEAGDSDVFKTLEMPTSRRQRRLGEVALVDGFILLDEVKKSPNEDIRKGLRERIIDQDDAIDSITDALDRSEVRLEGDNRPIANLAFLGPTGVGKSEMAKVLSELLSDDEGGNLVKIDCSSYSKDHEVASLTGAPPGYVGRGQKPFLNSTRVEKPGTVVLFDEIEKGSPDLYNLMLQIMGDGELRLNNGTTTSFRDAIIILTSNLGAREMSNELSQNPLGFGDRSRTTDKAGLDKIATKGFVDFFRPEFINRLNKMVVFHPLGSEGLGAVLDTKIEAISREYEETYGVRLTLSDAAKSRLVEIGAEQPHMGARPLVRALEDNIQAEFGRYVGLRKIPEGTHAHVFHDSDVPEAYPRDGGREFFFALKRDDSLLLPEEAGEELEDYNEYGGIGTDLELRAPAEVMSIRHDYDYDPSLSVPPMFTNEAKPSLRSIKPFIRIRRPVDRP